MPTEPPPPTLELRIDTEALAHNWRTMDHLSGAGRAGAAVKADAYGIGIDIAVPVLVEAGARDFFVAHWSEVPPLLAHVPAQSISVLHGPLTQAEAAFAAETGVRPVINSLHQARVWRNAGGGPCHLMVDTGINRLGLPLDALGESVLDDLEIEVLMSHLASADEDRRQNALQLTRFHHAMTARPARAHSLANSAGVALGEDYTFELTRPGLALYGGIPRRELAGRIEQVVYLRAQVLQVRDLDRGERVGYNATYTVGTPIRAATVSLGYADGFMRSWSGQSAFRFEGASLPQIGRVSMDMVVLDASAAPGIRAGDWVEIPYSLPEAEKQSGLSQYELLTSLGNRFARGRR